MKSKKNLYSLEVRLETFNGSWLHGSKSRAKKNYITWPHEKPSLNRMAAAGFYFNPSVESKDNATCFICQHSLDGWEPEDDPIQEHLAHAATCPWAQLCGRPWMIEEDVEPDTLYDTVYNPHTEESLNARMETFAGCWPHDSKKGWIPISLNMAKAGFYYSSANVDDDVAKCAYCEMELDGWEMRDDPVMEHKRRNAECLFFTTKPLIRDEVTTTSAKPTVEVDNSVVTKGSVISTSSSDGKGRKRASSVSSEYNPEPVSKKKKPTRKVKEETKKKKASFTTRAPKEGNLRLSIFDDDSDEDDKPIGEINVKIPPALNPSSSSTPIKVPSTANSTLEDVSLHMPGGFPKGKKKPTKKRSEDNKKVFRLSMKDSMGVNDDDVNEANDEIVKGLENEISKVGDLNGERPTDVDENFVQEPVDEAGLVNGTVKPLDQSLNQMKDVPKRSRSSDKAPIENVEELDEEKTRITAERQLEVASEEEVEEQMEVQVKEQAEKLAEVPVESSDVAIEEQVDEKIEERLEELPVNPHSPLPNTPPKLIHSKSTDHSEASDVSGNWSILSSSTQSDAPPDNQYIPTLITPKKNIPSSSNWHSIDVDYVFSVLNELSSATDFDYAKELPPSILDTTILNWINHNAELGELKLQHTCEKLVNQFREEGRRALEAIQNLPVVD